MQAKKVFEVQSFERGKCNNGRSSFWITRAIFIYDSFNFERGIDPIKSLNIGKDYLWDNLKEGDILICKKSFYLNYQHRFSNKPEHITKYSECIHTPIIEGKKILIKDIYPSRDIDRIPLTHIKFDYINPDEKEKQTADYDRWMKESLGKIQKHFDIFKKIHESIHFERG